MWTPLKINYYPNCMLIKFGNAVADKENNILSKVNYLSILVIQL